MQLRQWSLATMMVSMLGCGASTGESRNIFDTDQSGQPSTGTYEVGAPVDVNGDGAPDGVAVDSNGDGVADGVDTSGDGIKDQDLPSAPATGGGSPGGSTSGDGSGDPTKCEEHAVRNEQVTPDMLIVLDKSGSMAPDGNDQGVDRWQGSVAGLKTITAELDDVINFGLMTFPLPRNQCGAGMLDVPIGPMTASAIAGALDSMEPSGGTPTSFTLEAAHQDLANAPLNPDEVAAPKYVLLVTDGAPNCMTDFGSGGNPIGNCNPLDIQCIMMQLGQLDMGAVNATVDEITSMASDGIRTYVIGYQTQGTSLAAALDKMAAAGDTGDTAHRPVEDDASLVAAFREIAGKAISCTFVLDEVPPDPSYVLVKIDGKQLNLDDPNGWSLSADGRKVQVQGASCDLLQGGGQHLLTVDVLCEVVAPI